MKKALLCGIFIVLVILILLVIHLKLLFGGVYLSIFGPNVVLDSLESYYKEEFVIYDSKKVDADVFGGKYMEYYIHPVNKENLKFKISYRGGKQLSNSDLAFYYLTMSSHKYLANLSTYCVGAGDYDIKLLDYTQAFLPDEENVSRVINDVRAHTTTYNWVIHYPSDYDKSVGFSELLTGLRKLNIEFDKNYYSIDLYFGDELYVVHSRLPLKEMQDEVRADKSMKYINSLHRLPLGYNVWVSVSDDNYTDYRGDIFMKNMPDILSGNYVVRR